MTIIAFITAVAISFYAGMILAYTLIKGGWLENPDHSANIRDQYRKTHRKP